MTQNVTPQDAMSFLGIKGKWGRKVLNRRLIKVGYGTCGEWGPHQTSIPKHVVLAIRDMTSVRPLAD